MRLVKSLVAATLPMFVRLCKLHATKEMYYGSNTENTVFCVEVSRSRHFIPEAVRLFHNKILCKSMWPLAVVFAIIPTHDDKDHCS